LAGASIAQQITATRKGKIDEKASLNCIGGEWLAFRSRAAL
jgi:hypothetical protein